MGHGGLQPHTARGTVLSARAQRHGCHRSHTRAQVPTGALSGVVPQLVAVPQPCRSCRRQQPRLRAPGSSRWQRLPRRSASCAKAARPWLGSRRESIPASPERPACSTERARRAGPDRPSCAGCDPRGTRPESRVFLSTNFARADPRSPEASGRGKTGSRPSNLGRRPEAPLEPPELPGLNPPVAAGCRPPLPPRSIRGAPRIPESSTDRRQGRRCPPGIAQREEEEEDGDSPNWRLPAGPNRAPLCPPGTAAPGSGAAAAGGDVRFSPVSDFAGSVDDWAQMQISFLIPKEETFPISAETKLSASSHHPEPDRNETRSDSIRSSAGIPARSCCRLGSTPAAGIPGELQELPPALLQDKPVGILNGAKETTDEAQGQLKAPLKTKKPSEFNKTSSPAAKLSAGPIRW
ncbi:CCR4-NOT transcription complex subunit 3-like [Prinia subflava]|uniref:CCR4-NOT transcription complex subunit 3-like n=1 Tax=Prinia subflava TaxID=208062 RepID=UPI002FE10CDE